MSHHTLENISCANETKEQLEKKSEEVADV